MAVEGSRLTPWIHHRQVKKVETWRLPNGLYPDYGPIKITVSLRLRALPLPSFYLFLNLVLHYWYKYRVMIQPPLTSGLDWKLRKTDTGKVAILEERKDVGVYLRDRNTEFTVLCTPCV